MKLNRSTSHAIRILIECARADGQLVKVAEISRQLDITTQNVFKIIHILSRAELVAAVRGRSGGVRLARGAAQIRVGDIVRAMESTLVELDIEHSAGQDIDVSRGVNRVLDDALEAFIEILDRHSIADLASKRSEAPARKAAPSRRRKPMRKPALSSRPHVRTSG